MMLVLATPQQWAHPQRTWHATYLVLRYTSCDAVSVTATTLQCPLLLDTVCLYRVHDDCYHLAGTAHTLHGVTVLHTVRAYLGTVYQVLTQYVHLHRIHISSVRMVHTLHP